MWSMTAMKKQKSNDGIRGLFFLEPFYTLGPVGIDKSWPIHEFTILGFGPGLTLI
jgi:hypothetical protein